jgi:hypothetical protein
MDTATIHVELGELGAGMAISAWDQIHISGSEPEGHWSEWIEPDRFERGERLGRCRMSCRANVLQLVALAGLGITLYTVFTEL